MITSKSIGGVALEYEELGLSGNRRWPKTSHPHSVKRRNNHRLNRRLNTCSDSPQEQTEARPK
jgi:hypothetical protein